MQSGLKKHSAISEKRLWTHFVTYIHTHIQTQTNAKVSLRRYPASATNNGKWFEILHTAAHIGLVPAKNVLINTCMLIPCHTQVDKCGNTRHIYVYTYIL